MNPSLSDASNEVAVDSYDRTSDVRGRVACKKGDRVGVFLRRAVRFHGNRVSALGAHLCGRAHRASGLGFIQKGDAQLRVPTSWTSPPTSGPARWKCQGSELAPGARRSAGDDAIPASLAHAGRHAIDDLDHGQRHGLEALFPELDTLARSRRERWTTVVVDQHVDRTEIVLDGADACVDRRCIRQVSDLLHGAATACLNRLHPRGESDLGALGRQHGRDGATQSATSAPHERCALLQTQTHVLPFSINPR